MAAVVAAVAAYFASLPPPSSGGYPGGRDYRDHKTTKTIPRLVDIRPYIKDIPESVLQYCPQDLREHHLEHIWVPFCTKEFRNTLLLYKGGRRTKEQLIHLVSSK